ncbi:MAG: CRISPR-associated endonuclease Cas2 [Propionibacteriaceae bacterium]|jgi:CRISPR-associated protein Cas2|nr:CRISPR-associated endonuclease Cas2 [Propionibacteriaceae bacterium]
MAVTVLAAYDIADDRRRARVSATLQRWGTRIQYSVFICTLEDSDFEQLQSTIKDIVDPEGDSFLFIRQCVTCWEAKVVIGQAQPEPATLYWSVM